MVGGGGDRMQRVHRIGQVAMVIGMLGRRQVTPRWRNDPVLRHDGVNGIVARGG